MENSDKHKEPTLNSADDQENAQEWLSLDEAAKQEKPEKKSAATQREEKLNDLNQRWDELGAKWTALKSEWENLPDNEHLPRHQKLDDIFKDWPTYTDEERTQWATGWRLSDQKDTKAKTTVDHKNTPAEKLISLLEEGREIIGEKQVTDKENKKRKYIWIAAAIGGMSLLATTHMLTSDPANDSNAPKINIPTSSLSTAFQHGRQTSCYITAHPDRDKARILTAPTAVFQKIAEQDTALKTIARQALNIPEAQKDQTLYKDLPADICKDTASKDGSLHMTAIPAVFLTGGDPNAEFTLNHITTSVKGLPTNGWGHTIYNNTMPSGENLAQKDQNPVYVTTYSGGPTTTIGTGPFQDISNMNLVREDDPRIDPGYTISPTTISFAAQNPQTTMNACRIEILKDAELNDILAVPLPYMDALTNQAPRKEDSLSFLKTVQNDFANARLGRSLEAYYSPIDPVFCVNSQNQRDPLASQTAFIPLALIKDGTQTGSNILGKILNEIEKHTINNGEHLALYFTRESNGNMKSTLEAGDKKETIIPVNKRTLVEAAPL